MVGPGRHAIRVTATVAALLPCFTVPAVATSSVSSPRPERCIAAPAGKDSFCAVAGVRLHYVDWGGSGPAVILLSGLGDSARIFDGFAPLLTVGHRVIAVTRRGYGASATPADGDYSNAALVGDILALMDALSIPRATFVGHSIAGGELATLGADHAERVDRLVYIDAAYDRTRAPELMAHMPPLPPPGPDARHDLNSLTRWREAALGVQTSAVRANLAQIMRPGANGLVPRTSQSVNAAVLGGDIASKPRWDAIAAPSLAFFTSKDVPDQIPPDATAAQRAAFVGYSIKVLRPWMLRSQAEFVERTRCGVAVEVPRSTHYLFLERPEWTAKAVLAFLANADPCRETENP